MKKYFPILISKKGEFIALQHLPQNVKDEVCPVIEVLKGSIEKKIKENEIQKIVYKDDFVNFLKTHWSFFDNQIILDFSLFPTVGSKIEDVRKTFTTLIKGGVNIVPAIQKNSDPAYVALVKELVEKHSLNVCIRHAESSGDIDDFANDVQGVMTTIGMETSRLILLFDFGYIKENAYNSFANLGKQALKSLQADVNEWLSVVIAAGSFPEDLSDFKKEVNPNIHKRSEWDFYKRFKSDEYFSALKYSDYGTRHPIYEPAEYAGTISIKYTIENSFIVYKGQKSDTHLAGHGQYAIHAFELVNSNYYSGRGFSWGDVKIHEIAHQDYMDEKKRKPGSSTTWVQISQNHHIVLVHSLL